jgi:ABC-type uncharacterized transport system permease subunit
VLGLKLERAPAPFWLRALIPVLIVIGTFLLTAIILLWAGKSPLQGFYYFLVAPLSSDVSSVEVLVKSTPLLLTGAAVVFAFSAGYWNIGAEGQLFAGAIAAAWLGQVLVGVPQAISLAVMIITGFIAGMLWALGPAWLKVKLKVDEVVTTLLLNTVILFIVSYLLNGPWRDPVSMWPQSPQLLPNTIFFRLLPRHRLHFGFIVALVTIFIVWLILKRSGLGLRMRAIGLGREAARFAGVKVERTMFIAALVSGGIAGLAGVGEVAGIHYHLTIDISPGFGYTGIIAATLGGLDPIGSSIAALFISLIDTGGQTVTRYMGIPIYLGNVVQGILLLVALAAFVLQNYRIRRA